MLFRVQCIDRTTGAETWHTVEATDVHAAMLKMAEAGFIVGEVRAPEPIPIPQPSPAPNSGEAMGPAVQPIAPPPPPPAEPRQATSNRSPDEAARVAPNAAEILFVVLGGLIAIGGLFIGGVARFQSDNAIGAAANALESLSTHLQALLFGWGLIFVGFASFIARLLARLITTVERLGLSQR